MYAADALVVMELTAPAVATYACPYGPTLPVTAAGTV